MVQPLRSQLTSEAKEAGSSRRATLEKARKIAEIKARDRASKENTPEAIEAKNQANKIAEYRKAGFKVELENGQLTKAYKEADFIDYRNIAQGTEQKGTYRQEEILFNAEGQIIDRKRRGVYLKGQRKGQYSDYEVYVSQDEDFKDGQLFRRQYFDAQYRRSGDFASERIDRDKTKYYDTQGLREVNRQKQTPRKTNYKVKNGYLVGGGRRVKLDRFGGNVSDAAAYIENRRTTQEQRELDDQLRRQQVPYSERQGYLQDKKYQFSVRNKEVTRINTEFGTRTTVARQFYTPEQFEAANQLQVGLNRRKREKGESNSFAELVAPYQDKQSVSYVQPYSSVAFNDVVGENLSVRQKIGRKLDQTTDLLKSYSDTSYQKARDGDLPFSRRAGQFGISMISGAGESLVGTGAALTNYERTGAALKAYGGSLIREPVNTLRQTGSEIVTSAKSNPARFIGGVGGDIVVGTGAKRFVDNVVDTAQDVYVISGSKYVNPSKVFDDAVLSGKKTLPTVNSIRNAQKAFDSLQTPQGLQVITASPQKISGNVVGVGRKVGIEDPGIYVTPANRGSPYFLRVDNKDIPKTYSFTLNPIKDIFNLPTTTRFQVRNVQRYPRNIILQPGFSAVQAYQEQFLSPRAAAVITKRSEIGQGAIPSQLFRAPKGTISPKGKIIPEGTFLREAGTSELEAVIPVTSTFSYTPKTRTGRIKGFDEFTFYGGRYIPIRDARVIGFEQFSSKRTTQISGRKIQSEQSRFSSITNNQVSVSPYPYAGVNLRRFEPFSQKISITRGRTKISSLNSSKTRSNAMSSFFRVSSPVESFYRVPRSGRNTTKPFFSSLSGQSSVGSFARSNSFMSGSWQYSYLRITSTDTTPPPITPPIEREKATKRKTKRQKKIKSKIEFAYTGSLASLGVNRKAFKEYKPNRIAVASGLGLRL